MKNIYTVCAQYLLGHDYIDQVEFDLDSGILVSRIALPPLWEKLIKVEQYRTESGYIIKGANQYFGWMLARMAVKAALETNDLAFLKLTTEHLIIQYEKAFFDYLKGCFPDDVAEYSTASLTPDGLCYSRTSLFVSKIEDHQNVVTPGVVTGVQGSRQYVEVSYTSPKLWDYYFGTEYTSIQEILADETYESYRNLLLISLKA